MSLEQFLPALQRQPAFGDLLRDVLESDGRANVLSVADAARPYALAGLHSALGRDMLLVAARPGLARFLGDEIACWHPAPDNVLLFPEQDALPFEQLPADQQTTSDRLAILSRLAGRRAADSEPLLVVASARAAADLLATPADFTKTTQRLRGGDRARPEELIRHWLELGYEHTPVVDSPGQFGRRGGIIDVYPLVGEPCRIELFGDEIETLRSFDPLTQRSTAPLGELVITPSTATPAHSAGAQQANRPAATLLDYLANDGLLALDEPGSIATLSLEFERQVDGLRADLIERGELDPAASAPFVAWEQLASRIRQRSGPGVTIQHDPDHPTVAFEHAPSFGGRLRHFLEESRRLGAAGQRVVIVSQQDQRLGELLAEEDRTWSDVGPLLIHGQLQEGWQSTSLGLTVLTDNEIFGWHKIRRPSRPRRVAGRQTFLAELAPGELVVHVDHGIARYRGMVSPAGTDAGTSPPRREGDKPEREYLLLEYAQGDHLYVPADQADRVTRYVGGGEAAPTITRLGSGDWTRAKSRVRRAVREIAQDLLILYAGRQQAEGYAFGEDSPWQAELEASFPYVETADQLRALNEVKRDMEGRRPMDRLLVGDVGYGKTEVALRATFKAVESGKQVAILVPTTVLAQQHWNTFHERLAAFPIRVEMLSRFRADREQREVVRGLADGTVDVCIGTHRLLQKDVAFKDLGLVIIDEEQRFGVTHKERLKQLRREVDVLTLTATPIPRTLHMSLVGVRDMSTIETPPEERLPIRTFVAEHDDGMAREAILRELDRGGQVYYVHNRVQSIELEARRLRKLVPEARIAIGHGQMPEEQLERVMLEFAAGQHDLLVCTTIIESGLDIPNVNTLVVNNAHRFGLAQLYQLRGRIGRSAARAYAYFLFTRDTTLTETAERRLRTIFEATELGAGFRIALKDLEIRGAGNLLGAEQHGNINAVGFDLYTRLLAEAVEQLKQDQALAGGEPAERAVGGRLTLGAQPAATSISLPVAAYLPADYVTDEPTRLNFYQRLAAVTQVTELDEIVDELVDRFGPLPEAVQNLAYVVGLRLAARRAGVQQVQSVNGEVLVKFDRLPAIDVKNLSREVGVTLMAGSNQLRLPRGQSKAWMDQLQRLVERLPAQS